MTEETNVKTRERRVTEELVTELLKTISPDWVGATKEATNPHDGTKRTLFGKESTLKTSEVCDLMGIDQKVLTSLVPALENRLRRALIDGKMFSADQDPSAYRIWVPSDSTRGPGSGDPTKVLRAAGVDLSDLI
jgi:hypothetical protein